MLDLIMMVSGFGSFALLIAYTWLCDRL